MLNFVLTDGYTLVATRFLRDPHKTQVGAATLYFASGTDYHCVDGMSNKRASGMWITGRALAHLLVTRAPTCSSRAILSPRATTAPHRKGRQLPHAPHGPAKQPRRHHVRASDGRCNRLVRAARGALVLPLPRLQCVTSPPAPPAWRRVPIPTNHTIVVTLDTHILLSPMELDGPLPEPNMSTSLRALAGGSTGWLFFFCCLGGPCRRYFLLSPPSFLSPPVS